MARIWIVVGDMTSSGGIVITASPFTNIDGKGVARQNDKATCPLHKGVFSIVGGCDPTTIIDDQPVALHGATLACGCTVLAAQQNHVFKEDGARGSTAIQAAQATAAIAAHSEVGAYDEAFTIKSELTSKPLANRNYRITLANGSVQTGTTDADGTTHLVRTKAAEILSIELGEEVPA